MRYYRLVDSEGTLPADSPLQIGAIIRVPSTRSRKPGPVWNPDTHEWACPRWERCDNPQERTA